MPVGRGRPRGTRHGQSSQTARVARPPYTSRSWPPWPPGSSTPSGCPGSADRRWPPSRWPPTPRTCCSASRWCSPRGRPCWSRMPEGCGTRRGARGGPRRLGAVCAVTPVIAVGGFLLREPLARLVLGGHGGPALPARRLLLRCLDAGRRRLLRPAARRRHPQGRGRHEDADASGPARQRPDPARRPAVHPPLRCPGRRCLHGAVPGRAAGASPCAAPPCWEAAGAPPPRPPPCGAR